VDEGGKRLKGEAMTFDEVLTEFEKLSGASLKNAFAATFTSGDHRFFQGIWSR
jgi:hypothetical protein